MFIDWSESVIEAVVNISHGVNAQSVQELSSRLNKIGENTLHVDRGESADRTVYTILGEIDRVFDMVREMYAFANEHIDISTYAGNHPTVGAIDVVPFVPVHNITVTLLRQRVERFAVEIAALYDIPIIYYGLMSEMSSQYSLSQIRKGGISAASERIKNNNLRVDAGPNRAHETLGISCWTVRPYMAAYNINVNTDDLTIVKSVAKDLRNKRKNNPKLKDLKVIGWYVEEYDCCQLSTNLYDLSTLSMMELYDLIGREYPEIELAGSELIGMIPLRALDRSVGFENYMKYIDHLGLNSVEDFDPEERILELRLGLDRFLELRQS